MYAHVCIAPYMPEGPDSKYFEVKGVLLEYIPSYTLSNVGASPLAPSDTSEWQRITQSAVDITEFINRRGIIMDNCQPRNVLIDKRTQTPLVIDLAQCLFKDKMFKSWTEKWWDDEDDEVDPETQQLELELEYWKMVILVGNAFAIEHVMAEKLKRINGVEIDLKFPDYDKIVEDISRQIPDDS